MSVAVIIPTYNRAQFLMRALESVFSQSHKPHEVIVVDDGSTDDTRALVGRRFPQARYLYQEHKGVSAARNRGIGEAKSPWLALLDSDDEWLPHKLEKQLSQLQQNPGYWICHSDEIWVRDGRRVNAMTKHNKYGGYIFERCLPLCAISPSSVLLHRDLINVVGLFDESLPVCEDYDLWLRVCARFPVLYLDEPLLKKFGGHEDQLSRQYWGMDRFRIRALEKVINLGSLSRSDRRAAVKCLQEKLGIYVQGAKKRGKLVEARHYEAMRERYRMVDFA